VRRAATSEGHESGDQARLSMKTIRRSEFLPHQLYRIETQASSHNMRSLPSINGARITAIPAHAQVRALEVHHDKDVSQCWLKVQHGGHEGWILASTRTASFLRQESQPHPTEPDENIGQHTLPLVSSAMNDARPSGADNEFGLVSHAPSRDPASTSNHKPNDIGEAAAHVTSIELQPDSVIVNTSHNDSNTSTNALDDENPFPPTRTVNTNSPKISTDSLRRDLFGLDMSSNASLSQALHILHDARSISRTHAFRSDIVLENEFLTLIKYLASYTEEMSVSQLLESCKDTTEIFLSIPDLRGLEFGGASANEYFAPLFTTDQIHKLHPLAVAMRDLIGQATSCLFSPDRQVDLDADQVT
jgi:hypothetical protein